MKKNIFVFLLAIVMLMSSLTVFAGAASNLKGDIDNNGKIEAADARFILRASVGLEKIPSDKLAFADMDKDNKITAADARLALRTSVGLEKQEYITNQPNNTAPDKITFTETVVVDNDDCTIKITGIENDEFWGYTLKAFMYNKSSDITYMIAVDSAAINGVQVDPFFATEVAPGKKTNEKIGFYSIDEIFKTEGITPYTDIELTFRVYDTNNWLSDDILYKTIHIYPYGEENAAKFVRPTKQTDTVIIDNKYATVIVTGYEYDEIWGYTVNLFLINKTDKTLMFAIDEASVNGLMADPFYATTVLPGKSAFSSVSWSNTTLTEQGITEVNEIEFQFYAYDYNDWFSNNLIDEVITLNP